MHQNNDAEPLRSPQNITITLDAETYYFTFATLTATFLVCAWVSGGIGALLTFSVLSVLVVTPFFVTMVVSMFKAVMRTHYLEKAMLDAKNRQG